MDSPNTLYESHFDEQLICISNILRNTAKTNKIPADAFNNMAVMNTAIELLAETALNIAHGQPPQCHDTQVRVWQSIEKLREYHPQAHINASLSVLQPEIAIETHTEAPIVPDEETSAKPLAVTHGLDLTVCADAFQAGLSLGLRMRGGSSQTANAS